MIKLNFGTLKFESINEYYIALGTFCNRKAFSISYEPNKITGSFGDAYRMRKLATAQELIKPIKNALRSGGRINCNSYVETLVNNHNFVQSGKLIYGILENVINTVPQEYINNFFQGYSRSADNSHNNIIVFDTENTEGYASVLEEVGIPKISKKQAMTPNTTERIKSKRDYIRKQIADVAIGEQGEKLVFEHEKKKLTEALRNGKEFSLVDHLKWVSLDNDSAGYDIMSLDVNTMENIYIEVKATTGSKATPFYMSKGEVEFSKLNSNNYHIYRVFNLRNDKAEYFILSGDITMSEDFLLDASNYIVSFK